MKIFCLAGGFSCSEEWKKGLPTGRMVVIVPKTFYIRKQNEMIGFAYSFSQFSNAEIAEKIKQFLAELNLDEHEARIVEFNIFMDIWGYLEINIPIYTDSCVYSAPRYATGENLYIDPEGLTIWHLTYPLDGIDTKFEWGNIIYWEDVINISMVHDDPEMTYSVGPIGQVPRGCSYMCSIVSGFDSADVKIKHTIWTWTEAVWNYNQPYGSIFLLSVYTLIAYTAGKVIWKLKIKNHPE